MEEFERKFRHAELLADHIYTKYEEEFDELRSKMEDINQEQNQTSDSYNRWAQHLTEENQAIYDVASEFQARMLLLQDENNSMLEVS